MAAKKLIIADGHHRYETALNYRNERSAEGATSPAPWDSAMMTFVDMDSPGLVILPTHRAISGLPSFSSDWLKEKALQFFKIEEPDSDVDAERATEILRRAGQSGTALMAVTGDRVFLMHSPKVTAQNLVSRFSDRQRFLDVVQLHACVLECVLEISEDAIRNEHGISYHRDAAHALVQVRSGKAQVAFLMNPVRIKQVRDIALAGEVLPQKSTDFYPKLLSGLTIYAMD